MNLSFEIYRNSKKLLLELAKDVKRTSDDKGYIDYSINENLDRICKDLNFYEMQGKISKGQNRLFQNWLESLACKLQS